MHFPLFQEYQSTDGSTLNFVDHLLHFYSDFYYYLILAVAKSNEVDQGLDELRAQFSSDQRLNIYCNGYTFLHSKYTRLFCYIPISISSIESVNHYGLLTGRK